MENFMRHIFVFLIIFSSFAYAETPASRGNTFNPDISANMLFLYRNGSRGNDPTSAEKNGYSLQEAEIQFTSDVDVYARANALFAMTYDSVNSRWNFEPEEVFAESLSLPHVTLKGGKFKAAMGKSNTLHAHALPFIDGAMINTELLSDEGLNDAGVSVSGLLPTSWFSELTVQSIGASSPAFGNTSPNGTVTVGRLRNLVDITEDLTGDLGLSIAQGPNDVDKETQVLGADLTFKWRPSEGGKYSALIWSTEAMTGTKKLSPEGEKKTQGGATLIQWQFAERWWAQGRAEYIDILDSTNPVLDSKTKQSALLAFAPTEFSVFRFQYDHLEDRTGLNPENKVSLQVNLSIGAHPAHAY
jgi:hypothetical protein